jgi:hypothetical protein
MAIGERLQHYNDDEWFLLWARLEAAAIRLCTTACRNDVTGEILALEASSRAQREVEQLIACGATRVSAGKPFEAFARRRVTWRCLSALERWKRGPRFESLEDPVRRGSDERHIDRLETTAAVECVHDDLADIQEEDDGDVTVDARRRALARPADPLADPAVLALLRGLCRPRERALLDLIAKLEILSREQPQLSGPERSKIVMNRLGLSRNELDRQRYRLRVKLRRQRA